MIFVWILLGLALVVFFFVIRAVVTSVRRFSEPQNLLEKTDSLFGDRVPESFTEFSQWCIANGFVHESDFLFHGVINAPPLQCTAWWSEREKTWAMLYASKDLSNTDFVSLLTNNTGLTTSSSADAMLLPQTPNTYQQAFTRVTMQQQFGLHKQALELLLENTAASLPDQAFDLEQSIILSLQKQMQYIRSLPLWYLRGPYWFFIGKNLRSNKMITP